jgi:NAD(P)-dependent dehydrogenase (short-subunit alcohol dehydrogenase family)
MDLQLNGKTALVTGSTAGIGFAIALGLAREGAHVAINGRTPERAEEAAAKIRSTAAGMQVTPIAADVSTAEGCAKLAAALPNVDILINNAGIFEPKPFVAITDADWERFFQTNVMSGVRLSRHYLPEMLAQKWGRIVFISSESALNIPTEMVHYGMTKTAQLSIMRGLAQMTKGTAVTVNAVLPGPTASEGVQTFVDQLSKAHQKTPAEFEKEFFTTARPTSLLQRFASPEEIANLVVYVASPRSSATNGASLRAEGGIVQTIG